MVRESREAVASSIFFVCVAVGAESMGESSRNNHGNNVYAPTVHQRAGDGNGTEVHVTARRCWCCGLSGRAEGEGKPGFDVPLDNSRYNEYYVLVKPGGGP